MSFAALLVMALLLDAALGEPRWLWSRLPHPAVLMGRLVGVLDSKLNTGSTRQRNGVFCAGILVVAGLASGWLISLLGPVAEVVAAAILLAQRSLVAHVAAVASGLRGSLEEGRAAVAMIVSRETANMDESQVARGAIESAAENLSDGVVAPAFWFLLGGLPAMVAYKWINTADSMIGYRNDRYMEFGWAAARLDDMLNIFPARLTAMMIALPARIWDLSGIAADAGLHRSPNAGWPEAAMSRVLGIALSGPRAYDGRLQHFPWVNPDGRRHLKAVDINASIVILWKTWGLMLALLVFLAVALS